MFSKKDLTGIKRFFGRCKSIPGGLALAIRAKGHPEIASFLLRFTMN